MKYTDYLLKKIELEGIDKYRVLLPIVFVIDFLNIEFKKFPNLVKEDITLGRTLEYNPYTTDSQILYQIIKKSVCGSFYNYLKTKNMEHLIFEVEFREEDFTGILMFIKNEEYAFISLDDFLTKFDVNWQKRELKSDGLYHDVILKRVKK